MEKFLFYDGDKCTWDNAERWNLALRLTQAETGMMIHPERPAKDYPPASEGSRLGAEWYRWFGETFTDEGLYTKEMVQKYNNTFWPIYFDPQLIFLDTPYFPHLNKIRQMRERDFQCFLLSSNKEPTRKKRVAWMHYYGLGNFASGLLLKPDYPGMPDEIKYKKTAEWKAEEIWRIAQDGSHIYFIDDMEKNRQAVIDLPWRPEQKVIVLSSFEELQLPVDEKLSIITSKVDESLP